MRPTASRPIPHPWPNRWRPHGGRDSVEQEMAALKGEVDDLLAAGSSDT